MPARRILRERLDRRIRRPDDLTRRCDVSGARRPSAEGPPAPGRRVPAVRRGRPRLQPAPKRGGGRRRRQHANAKGQVIVVAGASRGSASTVVAANLAAAFARTGGQTVLVCAHLPDSVAELAPVTRLLGVRAVPGL